MMRRAMLQRWIRCAVARIEIVRCLGLRIFEPELRGDLLVDERADAEPEPRDDRSRQSLHSPRVADVSTIGSSGAWYRSTHTSRAAARSSASVSAASGSAIAARRRRSITPFFTVETSDPRTPRWRASDSITVAATNDSALPRWLAPKPMFARFHS